MTCYDFSHNFHYKSKTLQVKNLTCDVIQQRAYKVVFLYCVRCTTNEGVIPDDSFSPSTTVAWLDSIRSSTEFCLSPKTNIKSHALDLASTTAGRVGCPTTLRSLSTTTKYAAPCTCRWHCSISLISGCPSRQSCSNSQWALSCQVPPNPTHPVFVRVSVCNFSRATTRKPYLGRSIKIWGD